MVPISTLRELLFFLENKGVPQRFRSDNVIDTVSSDFDFVQECAASSAPIYGVNTWTGHRDIETSAPSRKSQAEILASHAVPCHGEHYERLIVKSIGLAKLYSISKGGVGISPGLFRHIISAVGADEFEANIYKKQSYSSGDVIPGAHWAIAVLNFGGYLNINQLHPGEALGLINGSFVHLGVACAMVPKIACVQMKVAMAMSCLALLSGCHKGSFDRVITSEIANVHRLIEVLMHPFQSVSAKDDLIDTSPQVNVSIRAFPELLIASTSAIDNLSISLNRELNNRSGNPLFDHHSRTVRSQGSFLLPTVAIQQSAIIDTLLYVISALGGAFQFVLSGRVHGIQIDGGRTSDKLGFIQVAKELVARSESLRIRVGMRPSAHGGSTSYGIEDFWTNGLDVSDILDYTLDEADSFAVRIITCCEIISCIFFNKRILFDVNCRYDTAVETLMREEYSTKQKIEDRTNFFIKQYH